MNSMRRKFTLPTLAIAMALLPLAQAADQAPASPLIKQINNGNWLEPKEAESLRDELDYQRAVHTYTGRNGWAWIDRTQAEGVFVKFGLIL